MLNAKPRTANYSYSDAPWGYEMECFDAEALRVDGGTGSGKYSRRPDDAPEDFIDGNSPL
jgi:hypothetical protein